MDMFIKKLSLSISGMRSVFARVVIVSLLIQSVFPYVLYADDASQNPTVDSSVWDSSTQSSIVEPSDGNNAPASDWNNSENWSDGNNAPASDWNNSENWSDGNNAPASDWNNSENWSDGNNAPASDWNNSENWSDGSAVQLV
jgi:hypothetical protein